MIKLTFLKELLLTKQVQRNRSIFVTIGTFWIKNVSFNHIYAMAVIMY